MLLKKFGKIEMKFLIFREKARNAKLIVAMSGNSTKITNPEVSCFAFFVIKMGFTLHFDSQRDTITRR